MIVLFCLLLAGAWMLLPPRGLRGIVSRPDPAATYADAHDRIERFRVGEPDGMNPLCSLRFFSHGVKTSRSVILVHGYTSCPRQFQELGRRLFASGSNVLIAPLPHHGMLDRMTADHSRLGAGELAGYADRVVDIATGLGQEVVIAGISAGGVTAAWAAQNRREVNRAVVISPAFGFRELPAPFTAAAMNVFRFLPDRFAWWDPVLKEDIAPFYAYPRYSRRALAEILRLGFAVREGMKYKPPAAGKIVMVTNAGDDKVNNGLTKAIAKRWREWGASIETFEFDVSLGLGHDLVDPDQPDEKIEIVYPKLIELMGG
ncbi:alpha/beta hydrolase [Prosthecochloris sp. GSB1]|uniref:alpha/beta hydrolase n=1 Tax=Prosthecochloris sp. GSB1 TaxID=281093 RepID=UPI000B8CFCBF|nr:alpha/beta hydrolase [Prosthecochloris sp. GSB1]ASQ91445.1 alpha/beta hydrolase [Prosthecochloris sp. GSB1]